MKKDVFECEIKVNGLWNKVTVADAHEQGDVLRRCMECHGPIVLMRPGPNGVPRAHAEHRPGHKGCSLGHYFEGTRTMSPSRIE